MDTEVKLKLTKAESLVLFEWLAGLDSIKESPFTHPSEEKVFWNLEAQLEATLTEPFSPSYKTILAEARKSVELS